MKILYFYRFFLVSGVYFLILQYASLLELTYTNWIILEISGSLSKSKAVPVSSYIIPEIINTKYFDGINILFIISGIITAERNSKKPIIFLSGA